MWPVGPINCDYWQPAEWRLLLGRLRRQPVLCGFIETVAYLGVPVSLCNICLQAVDTEVHQSAKELQQQLAAGMEQAAGGVADSQGRVQQLTVEHKTHSDSIIQRLGEQSKVRRFTYVAVGLCSQCQAASHWRCHTCLHTCVSLVDVTVLAAVCTTHTHTVTNATLRLCPEPCDMLIHHQCVLLLTHWCAGHGYTGQ